jgi:hypothetical protein
MKKIYDSYFITVNGEVFNKHKKLLTPQDNGKGYLILNLRVGGKRLCKSIHRLLAEAFIPNPENLPEVNHKDANRRNNALSNLEWCTHGYNIKYSFDLNNRSAVGSNNANCITTENTVHAICKLLESGHTSANIRDLGYNYALVRALKQKSTWKHISCNYNF